MCLFGYLVLFLPLFSPCAATDHFAWGSTTKTQTVRQNVCRSEVCPAALHAPGIQRTAVARFFYIFITSFLFFPSFSSHFYCSFPHTQYCYHCVGIDDSPVGGEWRVRSGRCSRATCKPFLGEDFKRCNKLVRSTHTHTHAHTHTHTHTHTHARARARARAYRQTYAHMRARTREYMYLHFAARAPSQPSAPVSATSSSHHPHPPVGQYSRSSMC